MSTAEYRSKRDRAYYLAKRDLILERRRLRKPYEPVYICMNEGKGKLRKHGLPIAIASRVIQRWCEENPVFDQDLNGLSLNHSRTTAPFTILGELSGIHLRRMHDLYYGKIGRCFQSGIVSVEEMDKVVTVGMGQPELWYAPPLDLYYTPIDEWTDEMKERHGQA